MHCHFFRWYICSVLGKTGTVLSYEKITSLICPLANIRRILWMCMKQGIATTNVTSASPTAKVLAKLFTQINL